MSKTIEKLFRYQCALEKYKKELDFRAKLEGKELEKRNKKPMESMPTPNLFLLANDDAYALKIKDRIIGIPVKTIPPRKTFTIPPRKTI